MGIDAACVSTLVRWFTAKMARGDAFHPNLLAALESARELRDLAASRLPDLVLLAMALPRSEMERFLEVPGLGTSMRRRVAPAPGGVMLGYEPISLGWGASHSWICTGLERVVVDALDIRPNAHGHIESREDALHVCRWLMESGRGEDGDWYPWLLIRYDA